MSKNDHPCEDDMIGIAPEHIAIPLDTKGKKFWKSIHGVLAGWESEAIKVDPPASYDNRTIVVRKSYDGPPKSVSELVERLKAEGASEQLIMHTVLLWAEKSYDSRTTIVRSEAYENKKDYDRRYQAERRGALKKAKDDAEKIVRLNDVSNLGICIEDKKESISKEDKKESKRDSGIRASEADFNRLWLAYPKRLGANPRKPAWDKFQIAIKNGATPEEIIKGAQGFASECRKGNLVGTRFVKTLVVWLNQHCWKDYQNVPVHNPMDGII